MSVRAVAWRGGGGVVLRMVIRRTRTVGKRSSVKALPRISDKRARRYTLAIFGRLCCYRPPGGRG
jgi:hypothetical protein